MKFLNFARIAITGVALSAQAGCQNEFGSEADLCNKVPQYPGIKSVITAPIDIRWSATEKRVTATYDNVTQTVKYGDSTQTPETDTARERAIEHFLIEPRDGGAVITVDVTHQVPTDVPPFKLALTFNSRGHLTSSKVSGELYDQLPSEMKNAEAAAFRAIAQQVNIPEGATSVQVGQIYSQLSVIDILAPIFATFGAELRPVKGPDAGTGFIATLVGRTTYGGRDALLLETKGKETIDLLKDGYSVGRLAVRMIGYSVVDRELNIMVGSDGVSIFQLDGSAQPVECSEQILKVLLHE